MSAAATTADETKDPLTLLFTEAQEGLRKVLEEIGKENDGNPPDWGDEETTHEFRDLHNNIPDIAKQLEYKVMSRLKDSAENWIKKHLTRHNISKLKESIYCDVVRYCFNEGVHQMDERWAGKFLMETEGMCSVLGKPYLGEVEDTLEAFNLAMIKAFNDHKHPSNSELLVIGQREYNRVCQHISNKEIQGLVQIGYEKLMGIFTAQNDIIQDMFKQVVTFYKNHLDRLSKEEFCTPAKLNIGHNNLKMMLSFAFLNTSLCIKFQDDPKQIFDIDIQKKVQWLEELIQAEYMSHLEAKQNNFKRLQEEMSELMSKATPNHQAKQTETVLEKGQASEEEKVKSNEIDQRAHRLIDEDQSSSSTVGTQPTGAGSKIESRQGQAESAENDREPSCESFESARQELLAKCEDINSKLEEGNTFNIKSAVTKKLFMIKIEDAIKLAGERTATRQQFQDQMEVLDTWSKKYKK